MTNDDGYRSAGIHALADALKEIGDVTIVAPVTEASAMGRGAPPASCFVPVADFASRSSIFRPDVAASNPK